MVCFRMAVRRYSKADFLNLLREAIGDIDSFYAQNFLNYRGIASDTKERYENIAAEFVLENLAAFENIRVINRLSSYKTDGHEQLIPDGNKINEITKGAVRRQEEWLAFKKPDSKETLLRCILEAYTYYKQVNCSKLLRDFELPVDSKIIPAVLIYKQSFAATGLGDLSLQKLRNTLGISIFLINETGGIKKV